MPSASPKRCFVAIPLDGAVRADLAEMMQRVRIDGLRKVPVENLHVTVKFLGDVDDARISEIIDGLTEAARGIGAFELNVEKIVYLPDARRARVLAVEFDRPAGLMQLVDQIEDMMQVLGFRREGRAYRPHVTVGRFKRPPRDAPDPESFQAPDAGFTADRLLLMQSILDRAGATYTPLAEVALAV